LDDAQRVRIQEFLMQESGAVASFYLVRLALECGRSCDPAQSGIRPHDGHWSDILFAMVGA